MDGCMRESVSNLLLDAVFDAIADMDERVENASKEAVEHRRLLRTRLGQIRVIGRREDEFVYDVRRRRGLECFAEVDRIRVEVTVIRGMSAKTVWMA